MRRLITLCLLLGCLHPKSDAQVDSTASLLVEIDELIIDQTITKGGRDFYEIFYSQWIWPETTESFTIYIRERPALANNTQVQIFVNDLQVFESFMQPRYDALVELSQYAMLYVNQYLINYEEAIRQLEGDDMSGTGIY